MDEAFRSMISESVRHVVREELACVRVAEPVSAGPPRQLLLVEDVRQQCQLKSAGTVREWIRSGRLSARKAGHHWVVKPADLERFLAQEKAEAGCSPPLNSDEHMDLIMRRVAARGTR